MAPWFDELASDLAEERISRRRALSRIAAGVGGAVVAGVNPHAAFAMLSSCARHEHRCGTACCGRHEHCASAKRHLCCPRHHKACVATSSGREWAAQCCPNDRECCPSHDNGEFGLECCPKDSFCTKIPKGSGYQGICCPNGSKLCAGGKSSQCCAAGTSCCLDSAGNASCCQPGEVCAGGVCTAACGDPPVYCGSQQQCCRYTFNGRSGAVCYDPSTAMCCPGYGACPNTYVCCSAGCCQLETQICCGTFDASGVERCGNPLNRFGC